MPPTPNNEKMLKTDKSNEASEIANILSFEVSLTKLFMAVSVFNTALCVITTPLGVPVVPEVKITYAISEIYLFSTISNESYFSNASLILSSSNTKFTLALFNIFNCRSFG